MPTSQDVGVKDIPYCIVLRGLTRKIKNSMQFYIHKLIRCQLEKYR